jgi:hypothetical protein
MNYIILIYVGGGFGPVSAWHILDITPSPERVMEVIREQRLKFPGNRLKYVRGWEQLDEVIG